jgi:hypothetical protein
MTAVAATPISLQEIPVVSADERSIICKQPHANAGMGTTHAAYCGACGQRTVIARQHVGALAEAVCKRCRAVVRYEVDGFAVIVTTTRRT